jgi:uncharacterized protein with von Willebrand factor type A (vWA) domain
MALGLMPTIRKLFGRSVAEPPPPLPTQAVKLDTVDEYRFNSYKMDAPRFRRTVEEAPVIAPKVKQPDPIDFATATPEEIKAWQAEAMEARRAEEQAVPYEFWESLARDFFAAYHHSRPPEVRTTDEMDPRTRFHSKIMQVVVSDDDFTRTRNWTRDDAPLAAQAVIKGVPMMREKLEHELLRQVQQSEEIDRATQKAQAAMSELESLRNEVRERIENGEDYSDLVQPIKQAVIEKRQQQAQAAQLADEAPVPLDVAGYQAIKDTVREIAGAVEDYVKNGPPGFGQGIGEGEPRYDSPEQALAIAEKWRTDKTLRQVSELYGKFDPSMRFMRAKRIEGGQDEIVDITVSDDLKRVTPGELAILADDEAEDDFYSRYLSSEILTFSTVGEEHAGRGPIIPVLDGSYSMRDGEPSRNASARAVCLALLDIARTEKRDFAVVEFSDVSQVASWEFPANRPLNAEQIVDMASHMFAGGTVPLAGIAKAHEIIERAPKFKNADMVLISDGEASFGDEDRRIRDSLREKGVRIHGIAIGASRFRYLERMCDPDSFVGIHDMDLGDPNAATAYLATQIT